MVAVVENRILPQVMVEVGAEVVVTLQVERMVLIMVVVETMAQVMEQRTYMVFLSYPKCSSAVEGGVEAETMVVTQVPEALEAEFFRFGHEVYKTMAISKTLVVLAEMEVDLVEVEDTMALAGADREDQYELEDKISL